MATPFRLEISAPKTTQRAAHTLIYTQESGVVIDITCELKKEKGRISMLQMRLSDKGWKIFGDLPDPAFLVIPIKLYMGTQGRASIVTNLVFDGKITQLNPGFPGPELLTITAHDKSIDARRAKKYRTFHNKNCIQIAQAIFNDYGLTVDVNAEDIITKVRTIDIGHGVSDWDHAARALAADGLQLHTHGSTVYIRKSSDLAYPTTFTRGVPPVLRFEVSISHVKGGGSGGDIAIPLGHGNQGRAVVGPGAAAVADGDAPQVTGDNPIGGPSSDDRATTEDSDGTDSRNQAFARAKRKDTATLTINATPDIMLIHQIFTQGWGAKADGKWYLESIKHILVPNQSGSTTSLAMNRVAATGAAMAAGVPLSFSG